MSEQAPGDDRPPRTGDAEIDSALAELDNLSSLPLTAQHDRLAAVHEHLHAALDRPRSSAEPD